MLAPSLARTTAGCARKPIPTHTPQTQLSGAGTPHTFTPPQTTLSLCPLQIEYLSSGTPLTNQHYIASPKGEFYGANHDMARLQAEAIAAVRAQTPVPNLYLTGTMASTMRTPLGKRDRRGGNLQPCNELRG